MLQLPEHGRYGYFPINERPQYSWPGGKRLAFHFATNIEGFAFGGALGHTIGAIPPQPDHRNQAWREYGLRVGAWNIFDMLDELGIPANHLVNTVLYRQAPQIFDRIRARGDEVIGHGRTNSERQGVMWEHDERKLIQEATDLLTKNEGKAPKGWMGPWLSNSHTTPDLLQEAGYTFLMDWPADDQPFWMKTRRGRILSVPYPIEINDAPQILARLGTASNFKESIIDQFEMQLELSQKYPIVMGISTHMMIMGQPFRLRHLREALRYIRNHPRADEVWFTTPGQIADYVYELPAAVVPFVEPLPLQE